MKLSLTILLVVAAAVAQQRALVPGSVEGVALAFGTGGPMANAPLRLSSTQSPAGRGNRGARGATPDFATTTDLAGRFALKGLGPGEYRLEPGAGYVYAGFQRDFRPVVFTVNEGQQIRGLRLPLVALSSVTGRVVDQNDQPQGNLIVELYELVYSVAGEKYLGQPRGSAMTDGNGKYRIENVEPNEFFLVARSGVGRSLIPVTYYPGVIDAENAVPIRVSGRDVGGVDVRLGGADLKTIRVRVPRPTGVASDFTALFTVSTQSRGRFTTALMLPGGVATQFRALGNDAYASPPLPADDYTIDVTWRSPSGFPSGMALMASTWRYPKARFRVHLEDKDADVGTIVNWATPASISGRVFAIGLDEPPKFTEYSFSLASAEPIADSVRLNVGTDGTFTLPALTPGRFSVRAQLTPNMYRVSARFGGREVLDTIFTVENDSIGPLEFTVAPGAGSIEGTVMTKTDDLVTFGRVVLVPSLNRRGNPNLFVSVFTDHTGSFSLKGIPPGDYTLLAWDWVRSYSYLNPGALSEYESRGKKITVARGSENRVRLLANEGSR